MKTIDRINSASYYIGTFAKKPAVSISAKLIVALAVGIVLSKGYEAVEDKFFTSK
jgi:hypothetical protein